MIHGVKIAGYITAGGRLLCSTITIRSSERATLGVLGEKHGINIPATVVVREFSRQDPISQVSLGKYSAGYVRDETASRTKERFEGFRISQNRYHLVNLG